MARRLRAAGGQLLVYNRTRSTADRLAGSGVRVARTPAEVVEGSDVVLTCLADVPATEEIWLSDAGLLAAARPDQVLADHSTVDPGTSRRCFEAARARGAQFLDAPVSGGPVGAEAGTLTIMVGGEQAAFDRALPVFRVMGHTVAHIGGPGAGTAAKLVNQLLVGVHAQAACEALLLAGRSGLDLDRLVPVLMESWGASRMLARNTPYVRDRRFGPSPAPLRNLIKDLDLVARWSGQCGAVLPAAAEARRLFREAASAGMTDDDLSSIYRLIEGGTVETTPSAADPEANV